MPTIEARLSALGVDLPEMAAPAANYVPFSLSGKSAVHRRPVAVRKRQAVQTGFWARI